MAPSLTPDHGCWGELNALATPSASKPSVAEDAVKKKKKIIIFSPLKKALN